MTTGCETARESMTIRGRLDAEVFVPWIRRYKAKLGLAGHVSHADAGRIEIELSGPVELIDMLELGCSLGPIEVWVDSIDRAPADTVTRLPIN